MNKTKTLGLLRHILTYAGGYLAARGTMSDSMVTEIVASTMAIIGVIWSTATPEKQDPAE